MSRAAKRPSVNETLSGAEPMHDGRDRLAFVDQLDGSLGEHGRGMAHRAAGMRAAADAHHVGVAENDAHAVSRHVKQVGDHLGETGFVALPGRLRADDHIDMGGPSAAAP